MGGALVMRMLADRIIRTDTHIEYWYSEDEKAARKWDMEYVRNMFPGTMFRENKGQDHAEFFTLHPKEFCRELLYLLALPPS